MDHEIDYWICRQLNRPPQLFRWYELIILWYELDGNGTAERIIRANRPAVKVTGVKHGPHNFVLFVRNNTLKRGRIKKKHSTWCKELGSLDHYMRWYYQQIFRLLHDRSTRSTKT